MVKKRAALLDSILICILTALLIGPLFKLKYLDNWGSIESTFISDSRMLINNFPHPGWQPLWYCGTRFDYIYPPALRYGTALIAWGAHMSTARAYHLYTAILYVLGILAVYWLVRIGSGSRKAGLLASGATALLSPSFLFMTAIRADSGWWVPQRLHVLMSYGEGPHISALCVLTAALALCFPALRKWNPPLFAGAAALCAFAVSNNFYGATALAVFFPFQVWSVWIGQRDWRVLLRAAGVAALAWGLCAFWLTPSYVGITIVNMQWVSQPGNRWSMVVAAVVCALFCAITWRAGNRRPEREWTIFTVGVALFLSLNVIGLAYFGFRIYGEPYRLVPELDLALILLSVEALRHAWLRPRWRVAVALIVVVAFSPAWRYLRHAWTPFPKVQSFQDSYEYETGKWLNDHLRGQRVLPSGSLRFWFDAWFDNPQADGGSMQGMLNQILPAANWQIIHGPGPELATLWLQALGTDAVVAPDKNSRDYYHDYEHAEKFKGILPALHDDGHGTVIYGVPRVHPGIGRVVDKAAIRAVGPFRGGDDADTMTKYVAAIENPAQPATTVSWKNFDEAEVRATTLPGEAVLLQETYDPDWKAYENGKELQVEREPVVGFMLIDVGAGNHAIKMSFENFGPQLPGRIISILSVLLVAGLFFVNKPRKTVHR